MTTDRTQPARPPALNDRSSAAPAERRDGSAFAALLGAHTPAPARREETHQRDGRPRDAAARQDQPRDAAARRDQPRDAAVRPDQPRDAAGQDPAAAQPVETPAPPAPEGSVPAKAGQPVVIPPFVATVAAEAPAVPAPPVPPAATAPLFMLAPEAVAAAVPAMPVAPEVPAGVPAAATPQTGVPPAPAAAVPTQPAVAPAQGETVPAGEAPAQLAPQAPQAPAQEADLPAAPVRVAAEAPAASEPQAAAPARVARTPEPAPAPAAQAPTVEPFAPTSAQTPPAGPVAPERTVPLHRAPAAVSTLLHVAAERGITHAKMALRPVELGGIEIRLQASAAGIAAQVIADSPEAAKLLAQAGEDLRRALEARDVTLISLEVSTTADQQQRQSARNEWSDSPDGDLTSAHRTARDAEGDAAPAPTTQTVIELPGGLLVDVLA